MWAAGKRIFRVVVLLRNKKILAKKEQNRILFSFFFFCLQRPVEYVIRHLCTRRVYILYNSRALVMAVVLCAYDKTRFERVLPPSVTSQSGYNIIFMFRVCRRE